MPTLDAANNRRFSILSQGSKITLQRFSGPINNHTRKSKCISRSLQKAILMKLENLLHEPNNNKKPFFIILGQRNADKTVIVDELLKKHPVIPESNNGCIVKIHPIVSIKVPSRCREGELYNCILKKIQIDYKQNDPPDQKRQAIERYFGYFHVEMLIVDNIHNALMGHSVRKKIFINAITCLKDHLGIPIVLIGKASELITIPEKLYISSNYVPVLLPK